MPRPTRDWPISPSPTSIPQLFLRMGAATADCKLDSPFKDSIMVVGLLRSEAEAFMISPSHSIWSFFEEAETTNAFPPSDSSIAFR